MGKDHTPIRQQRNLARVLGKGTPCDRVTAALNMVGVRIHSIKDIGNNKLDAQYIITNFELKFFKPPDREDFIARRLSQLFGLSFGSVDETLSYLASHGEKERIIVRYYSVLVD